MTKPEDILVAIDDGHGMETPGKRTPKLPNGRVIKENEFNSAVAKMLGQELTRCGVRILYTAPTDADTPLQTRTNLANAKKATLFVSIHYNALSGSFERGGRGIETFIDMGIKPGTLTYRLGANIHAELIKDTPLVNRGLKNANYHVLRETKMPAVLVECGFMDNLNEAYLMISEDYQRECAVEIARGICKTYGIKYVPAGSDTPVKPPTTTTPKPPTSNFLIRVKVPDLWYYSKADWDARKGQVHKGDVFTVVQTLTVAGAKMYKLKSGSYITASPKYVERV